MAFLYTIAVTLYARLIWLASFRNEKAKLWWKGRQAAPWKELDFRSNEWIWFHCASLGEFDQGIPLMEVYKQNQPDIKIIVTFFSPSGMVHYKKRNAPVDFACYLPIDTTAKAKEFVLKVQPKKVFFVKYEFWHNHIRVCKELQIPVFSISSIFREKQIYFKSYGSFFRGTLKNIAFFYVQNEKSKRLLSSIGIDKVATIGDLRFDRVISNAQKANPQGELKTFTEGSKTFIVGSCWDLDLELILPFIHSLADFKIILAPHQIDENQIKRIESQLSMPTVRFSQFDKYTDQKVLLLDSIGHLMNAYSLATVAYVGGGFTGKLHNILEPIAFKVPVLFGPKHEKFPEASHFLQAGIGFEIKDGEELKEKFGSIVSDEFEIKKSIETFLSKQANISSQLYEHIEN